MLRHAPDGKGDAVMATRPFAAGDRHGRLPDRAVDRKRPTVFGSGRDGGFDEPCRRKHRWRQLLYRFCETERAWPQYDVVAAASALSIREDPRATAHPEIRSRNVLRPFR